jgi:hypothetical protein
VQSPQYPSTPLQAKDRKRKQSQEAPVQKRLRTSRPDSAVEHENEIDPIDHWRREGTWPKEYFEQDDQIQIDLEQDSGAAKSERDDAFHEQLKRMNMTGHYLLARKKSSASLRRQNSESRYRYTLLVRL